MLIVWDDNINAEAVLLTAFEKVTANPSYCSSLFIYAGICGEIPQCVHADINCPAHRLNYRIIIFLRAAALLGGAAIPWEMKVKNYDIGNKT